MNSIKVKFAACMLEANHEVVVLDISAPEKFEEGHIAKAINID